MVITAVLVVGIKESARFNATIVVIKVAVVLFVIGLGVALCVHGNWGTRLAQFCADGFQRHWGGSGVHLFCVYRI